jgi:hypothetical protein
MHGILKGMWSSYKIQQRTLDGNLILAWYERRSLGSSAMHAEGRDVCPNNWSYHQQIILQSFPSGVRT